MAYLVILPTKFLHSSTLSYWQQNNSTIRKLIFTSSLTVNILYSKYGIWRTGQSCNVQLTLGPKYTMSGSKDKNDHYIAHRAVVRSVSMVLHGIA